MVLGPEYSRERYGLIFSNIALMLLGSVVSAFAPKPMKFYLLFSSIILAVVWAYVWVVNSTV
jgi:lipopolysaccharide export LptBFGC system permease protein LptF